jgi:hypothetical protein
MEKYERNLVGLATGRQLWRLNQLNLLSSLTYGKPITKAEAHRTLTEAQLTGVWKTWPK